MSNNLFSEIFDSFDLKGVHIVPSGATFDDDMTWETAETFGVLLASAYDWMQNDLKMVYGDFLNHCELRWGETYAQLVYITGMAVEQLRDYKWVAGQVPLSLRNDSLRYSHYRIVAKSSLSIEQKLYWLNATVENGWGARELRDAVAEWEKDQEAQRDAETERMLVDANLIETSADSSARAAERFVWQEGDIQIIPGDPASVDDEPENGVFAMPQAATEEPTVTFTSVDPDEQLDNDDAPILLTRKQQREIITGILDAERALVSFDYEKARAALRRVKRMLWSSDDA